jgi:hypothetical protein
MNRQYRQGDVFLREVAKVPKSVNIVERENGRVILAHGEVTGHSHAIGARGATLYMDTGSGSGGRRYLQVAPDATDTIEVFGDARCLGGSVEAGWIFGPRHVVGEQQVDGACLRHEEHTAVVLPPGIYEVVIQREYTPEAIRNVAD